MSVLHGPAKSVELMLPNWRQIERKFGIAVAIVWSSQPVEH